MLLFASGPLAGGADLVPHLRLMERMAEAPALRSVYAPAFHVFGAALGRVLGWGPAVQAISFGCAAGLIFGFRAFQRAAGLPVAAAAIFPWTPYLFSLSWCLPKIEAAGYGLAFAALALLWRKRHVAVAFALAATFCVHTGAALFLGLVGGALALLRGDHRGLVALAAGVALTAPLFAAHLAAGCTLAEALLLSPGDYLRPGARWSSAAVWPTIAALAGPVGLAAAAAGAAALVREHRDVAWIAALSLVVYTNEIWLAPFGAQTTLNLLRGLTVLAFPVALAAGMAVASRPRAARWLVLTCALWSLGATWWALPGACHRVPVDAALVEAVRVDRCAFRWRFPGGRPERQPSAAALQ